MKNEINFAQIGIGYWGKNLFRNFYRVRNIKKIVACDNSETAKQWLQVDYPHIDFVNDYQSLLHDRSIDAVAIATQANSHFDLAKEFLLAGKHVFVEKPLTLQVDQAQQLVVLAREKNLFLMVGHTFLYNAAVQQIKLLLEKNTVGDIYYIYAQRLNLGKVRSDVDVVWNLAPHDLSILLYWLKEMPIRVSAHGYIYIQPNVADVAFLNLEFPSGISAHIHVSWLDPNKKRNMTIVGSEKMIFYEDTSSDAKIKIFDKGISKQNIGNVLGKFDNFGKFQLIHRAGDLLIPKLDFTEPLRLECEHFIQSIVEGGQPKTNGQHGLDVVKILAAARASMEQNGKAIELNL